MTTQQNPITQKALQILVTAVEQGASDVHFAVGRYPTLRIDGSLVPLSQETILAPDDTEALAQFFLSETQQQDFAKDGHVDLSYNFQDRARFRVNIFRQKGYVGIVMRVINNTIRSLQELNISPIIYEFAKFSQGLFLVTGPVGHGKSSTLAALMDYINHNKAQHIVTVEDPIEYIYEQDRCIINQREIGQDAFSFSGALRAALREDANVILIGEMRDIETISTAITAAETGHLIFGTLHTNDAAQTIDRIIDTFSPHQQNQVRAQLASVLLGVVSQRLLPRVDAGRVPAVEVMIKNHAIENLIRENKTYQIDTVIETSLKDGMVSLDRSLATLVQQGVIAVETALPYAKNQEYFNMLIGKGQQINLE